ncbi:MAG: glycoside hydrolase family 5 protein [Firmicutes bacterium]|nr:glycoside hydrolase family 5 protein [Bacillota bacterium]
MIKSFFLKGFMIFSLVFILLAIVPARQVLSKEGHKAKRIAGPLHREGMKIIDSRGEEVIFRGVNVSGMEWGAGYPWVNGKCTDPKWGHRYGCYGIPPDSVYDNIAEWGFNMVRVPICWANIENEPGGPYNEEYLKAVDHIVQECAKRNIAVVFSMHQWVWSPNFLTIKRSIGRRIHGNGWPVWLYPPEWFATNPVTGKKRQKTLSDGLDGQTAASREFFKNERIVNGGKIQDRFIKMWVHVAKRYAAYPNVVGADIINEPYQNNGKELEDLYIKAGNAISKVNSNMLLIYEKSLSSRHLDISYILRDPLFQKKGVLEAHMYPASWDKDGVDAKGRPMKSGKKMLMQDLSKAKAANVPLWIGEFHCIMEKGHKVKAEQTRKMLDYMKKSVNGITDISWSYWAYQRDAQPLDGETGNGPVNMELVRALQEGF